MVGALFVFSGFQKLIAPYQNFLYVIESYSFLPGILEEVTARALPWVELFLGVFLLLGLWLKVSLKGLSMLLLLFIMIVGQAMIRKLPVGECGCFGEKFSLPLPAMILVDSGLLILSLILLKYINRAGACSLDAYFEKNDNN